MDQQPPNSDTRSVISGCRPFAELPPELVELVLSCMTERRFDAGETLIRQGDAPDFLFVLLDGTAKADVHHEGGKVRTVGRFHRGDVVGEMALLTHEPRTADVVASTPVRAYCLPARDFHRLAGKHPGLAVVLTNLVSERLGRGRDDGMGGKVLHGHRILRCVGRGGMAMVYEAQVLDGDRRVALKMMSHRLLYQPGALRRFRSEAEIVRTLDHENVAKLYGQFSAYGTHFLVMELCEGRHLADLVKRHGAFPEPQVRRILGQLAGALRYVHARDVIHRDMKPSNVMLDRKGVVKLMDFGLAKPELPAGELSGTPSGTLVGTPDYMAPEMISGEKPDARTDLYGLACIAFEMLAGRRLFRGPDILSLLQQKVSLTLPPRSEIGDGISAEMYEFVTRGLKQRREDRRVSLDHLVGWSGIVEPSFLAKLFDGQQAEG